jgi:hypothetical protein
MKDFQKTDTYQLLIKKRDALLKRVKEVLPKEAVELEAVCRALEAGFEVSPGAGKYTGTRKAIDAVCDFLEETGHAVKRMELAEALLDQGFALGEDDRKWLVIDAIRYHSEVKDPPTLIVGDDDMVSLSEWASKGPRLARRKQ